MKKSNRGQTRTIGDLLWGREYAAYQFRNYPAELKARCESFREMRTFFAKYVVMNCSGPIDPKNAGEPETVNWAENEKSPGCDTVEATILEALAGIVELPCELCAWSAVHGLGHLHERQPTRVKKIIDSILRRPTDWPPELIEYAKEARAASGHFQ